MSKLTDRLIQSIIKSNPGKSIKKSDGGGLFLLISPKGSASWKYSYRFEGKQKTLSLGQYPRLSLREARLKHHEAVELLFMDVDPSAKKQAQKRAEISRQSETFQKYAVEWFNAQVPRWSEGHAKRVFSSLKNYLFPEMGNVSIHEVTVPLVKNVIDSFREKGILDTSSRLMERINSIMNYCVQTGVLTLNPCLSLRGYVKVPPAQHQPALPEQDLVNFFKKLILINARTQTKLAMLFTIITFVRQGSLRSLEWSDIDLSDKKWVIPEDKFKGSRTSLIVPLSSWAIEILEKMQKIEKRTSGFIFCNARDTRKMMSENALSYLLHRMEYRDIATPHGFRSLATDILNEKSPFSADSIERQMGHVESNAVRRAYHRTEYLPARIEMMDWYSSYIKKYYEVACKELGQEI